MSMCEVGGYVVYSTCTLSTAQNQAVIEACLSNSQTKSKFAIVNPTRLINLCAANLSPKIGIKVVPAFADCPMAEPIGAMVLPCLAANYGPTFFCKLKRIE